MEILLDFAGYEWIQSYKRNINLKASTSVACILPSKIFRVVEAQCHSFSSQGFAFWRAAKAIIFSSPRD